MGGKGSLIRAQTCPYLADPVEEGTCRRHSKADQAAQLDRDSLDLIERDLIGRAVVKLCGPRAFVSSDCLSVLERSAIQQIGRDACRAEGVAVCGRAELGLPAPPLDHAVDIDAGHAAVAEAAFLRHAAPERCALLLFLNSHGLDIGVEILLRLVMDRHLMMLAVPSRAAGATSACPAGSNRRRSC